MVSAKDTGESQFKRNKIGINEQPLNQNQTCHLPKMNLERFLFAINPYLLFSLFQKVSTNCSLLALFYNPSLYLSTLFRTGDWFVLIASSISNH